MIKRTLIATCCLAVILSSSASTNVAVRQAQHKKPVQSIDAEELERAIYKSTGGKVIKPGTMLGKIVYVNSQKAVPESWIRENANAFRTSLKVSTEVEQDIFSFPSPTIHGNATLFIIDDEKMPNILCAPENRWAMVNVTPLKAGAGSKEAFFRARVQKEITRALCLLIGAQNSHYQFSILKCITKTEQLDDIVSFGVPVDVVGRFRSYMAGYGIIPGVEQDYRKACQEGWAPAPTDTVQRVIWDRVHAIPDKPMQIKFDPAAQKGKVTK